jgi:hypothetical protein
VEKGETESDAAVRREGRSGDALFSREMKRGDETRRDARGTSRACADHCRVRVE